MTAALNLDDDESQFVMILPSKEDKRDDGQALLYSLENQKLHFEDGSYVLRHLLAGVRTRV